MVKDSVQSGTPFGATVMDYTGVGGVGEQPFTARSESSERESAASIAKQVDGGGGSEIAWLQKLPGYPRVRKQLFNNLMTAALDTSRRNVRVESAAAKAQEEGSDFATPTTLLTGLDTKRAGAIDKGEEGSEGSGLRGMQVGNKQVGEPSSTPMAMTGTLTAESCLDRRVIKRISDLYTERAGSPRASSAARGRKRGGAVPQRE